MNRSHCGRISTGPGRRIELDGFRGWLTSIVRTFMIGGLPAYTRSLGACIVAHGVMNLLLELYVPRTKQ